MPIIPRKPFWDIEDWFDEDFMPERILRGPRHFMFSRMRAPRMDVYETKKDVIAKVELPGVDPKDIEVEVKDNVLRIEAKSEEKKEKKEKGYFRKEISSGYFKRAVRLPSEVIGNKAKAEYKEGILEITIPKKTLKKKKEKAIKIKVKGTKTV